MKTYLLLLFAVICSFNINAQTPEKGTINFNAGIGVPNNIGRLMKTMELLNSDIKVKSSPVYQFSIDGQVGEEFQIGFLYGHSSVHIKDNSEFASADSKINTTILGLKLEYITDLNDKSNIYAGPTIMYSIIQFKNFFVPSASMSGIGIYPHVGITRKFSKTTSGYFELGYGMALLNAGLKVRLK